MPTTTMVTTAQTIEIDQISDVVITAIAHDDVAGDFYRDLIFFGTPPEMAEGTTTPDLSTIPTVLKVRIRASAIEPLKVTVPEGEF